MIVMIKPGLDCEECTDLDSECEIIWIKLTTSKQRSILVGAFYREPRSQLTASKQRNILAGAFFREPTSPSEILNKLEISLCKIKNSKKVSQL